MFTGRTKGSFPAIFNIIGLTGYDNFSVVRLNLTGDGSNIYVYDIENRLVSASGATTAGLRYDPLGRLYETSGGPAGVTRFLYDGDELVAEYNSSGTQLRRYVHGPGADDPLVWYEGAGTATTAMRRLRTNHQGSVVAIANNAGAMLAINRYDDYGIPQSNVALTAAAAGRFLYTGQAWIPEMGTYIMGDAGIIVHNAKCKGKTFRGGKKSSRDKWYGYDDKDFQNWWHREGKKDFGGNDLDNADEAAEAFQIWRDLGSPKVK